ncbi:MAG: peptide deformylase [Sphaerochaetaceae bacterium]|nr:peptide deformylase [Sphaerochaetaceae bacterium]
MLDIYTIGDEVLREKGDRVTKFDPSLAILIDAMYETLEEADGIGLAAPQVGISKRFFIVDTRRPGERIAFFNPEIVEMSHEVGMYEEGCLSIPGVYYDIERPLKVTVQAQDVTGKAFQLEADGILARVIQHEYDHLEGILFVDRMEEGARERLLKAYDKKHRKERKR